MARGLAVNWKTCNRREAGMVFAHMNDESAEAKNIISSLSTVAKTVSGCVKLKVEPRSFLIVFCSPFPDRSISITRSPLGLSYPII